MDLRQKSRSGSGLTMLLTQIGAALAGELLGLFAPPFGVGYYAACAIGRVEPVAGMRPILGYMLALVIGTIIVAAVPWISIGFLD